MIAGHNIWEWIFLLVSTWNVALLLASSGVAIDQCELNRSLLTPEFTTEVVTIIVASKIVSNILFALQMLVLILKCLLLMSLKNYVLNVIHT